jgi:serine/threonine protein kinase
MAPEFFASSLETDGYSYTVDIYAAGILLYELLVG